MRLSINKLFALTLSIILISIYSASAQVPRGEQVPQTALLYKDLYLREQPNLFVFGNSKLKLELSKDRGQWLSLSAEGIPGNLISTNGSPVVDFRINDVWMIERHGANLLRHEVSIDRMRNGVSLRLVFGISPQTPHSPPLGRSANAQPAASYDYELACSYTLFPEEGRLERAARLVRTSKGNATSVASGERMQGFLFQVPGAVVSNPAECVVNVPGPFFPKTFVKPDTPYTSLTNRSIDFHSAPDAGFGLLAISNTKRNTTLASWMDTAGEVAYRSALHGDGKQISIRHHNLREYRLLTGMAVDSDSHRIEVVTGPVSTALHKYREMVMQRMPMDAKTPEWVREMVMLEVYPQYFAEGFKGLTKKLPFYRQVGFNTIYIMPHWIGGYSPIDLFKVNPPLGTTADLQETVRTAHRLGMKVLFDMVIHGFNEKSEVTRERPDLFVRTEEGALARHPTWKSITTDWASPVYQQYMVNLVRHDLKTYDIDGYRVDAATFKGASWDPKLPYPAYRSGSAAPELMRHMLDALRKEKPDAVLLSEVFGPVFYTVSNLVHDNQTEAPQLLLEKMETGEVTAKDYKAHIAGVLDMLPAGANRVYFARNHDTSWFYHFNGYTPRFMAMDAVHALFGIPEVFGGDPKPENGPSPDRDPAVYDYYRKLFAVRKDFPELARGDVLLREAECDNSWVFTGLRRLDGRITLATVSFSDKEERATIQIKRDALFGKNAEQRNMTLKLRDAISGETVEAQRVANSSDRFMLKLKPFQVLVGRL